MDIGGSRTGTGSILAKTPYRLCSAKRGAMAKMVAALVLGTSGGPCLAGHPRAGSTPACPTSPVFIESTELVKSEWNQSCYVDSKDCKPNKISISSLLPGDLTQNY